MTDQTEQPQEPISVDDLSDADAVFPPLHAPVWVMAYWRDGEPVVTLSAGVFPTRKALEDHIRLNPHLGQHFKGKPTLAKITINGPECYELAKGQDDG